MITIEDCQAFCDASASEVSTLAGREHLPLLPAIACAHHMVKCTAIQHPEESPMISPQPRPLDAARQRKIHPLRPYPCNSPQAMSRLVVLALLADGQLAESELKALERRGAYAALRITREDFVQVLHEFCADVARLSVGTGGYRLSPALLDALFDEVDDPAAKERVLNLIVAVVSADGRITEGEQTLFLGAINAWGEAADGRAAQPPFDPWQAPRQYIPRHP